MEILEGIVSFVNSILWDYVLIIGLVGTGIYLTIALGFPQVKRFGKAAKRVFGGVFNKEQNKEGSMSSFQALATSIAAQVGTGNIAGVATSYCCRRPWSCVLDVGISHIRDGNYICRSNPGTKVS